jgi:pimeloyl-ACP methyl ester carboxylesterase
MTKPNPQSPKLYVLVHGAFRGGWSWQKVRQNLQKQGHEVFAPSLTGAGEKSHLNSTDITLETWKNDIVNLINSEDLQDVILVGHSQGGIIIQFVAEEIFERISQMIFIDAPVLQNDECALDIIPEEIRKTFGETPKNALIPPIPLKPNKDFSEEEIEWINERLSAVPTNPSFEKITIEKSSEIPHKYIFCKQTPPMFPASFTRKRFDNEGIEYQLINTGHDCIMSHPELIAEALLNLWKITT